MNYLGREEKKFEVNKTALYVNVGMWIFFIIMNIICISFAQEKLDRFFISSSERQLYGMMTTMGIVGIIGSVIAMILPFTRMKCYLSVCENGIEGRAGTFGNEQVTVEYSDISEVQERRQIIIIKTKRGASYTFCVRDSAICANLIKSRIRA